jgi:hypothetical protein
MGRFALTGRPRRRRALERRRRPRRGPDDVPERQAKFFDYTTDTRSSGFEPNFRWTKPSVSLVERGELQRRALLRVVVPGEDRAAHRHAGARDVHVRRVGVAAGRRPLGRAGAGREGRATGRYLENWQTEPEYRVMNAYDVAVARVETSSWRRQCRCCCSGCRASSAAPPRGGLKRPGVHQRAGPLRTALASRTSATRRRAAMAAVAYTREATWRCARMQGDVGRAITRHQRETGASRCASWTSRRSKRLTACWCGCWRSASAARTAASAAATRARRRTARTSWCRATRASARSSRSARTWTA